MSIERFNKQALEWDEKIERVNGAMIFVEKIKEYLPSDIKSFKLLDYGCGTGLVSFGFAKDVKKIIGLDNSSGMIEVYNNKANRLGFVNINGDIHDIEKESIIPNEYDIIATNMTMHHIRDTKKFIEKLYSGLKKDGRLFIADLNKEEGDFHTDNTGVYHFGFEEDKVKKYFHEIGFKEIFLDNLTAISKSKKDYKFFFITGRK